ncbi:Prolyl-tRNA editing protein ProX [bioreactor metagenome]|uniref:Prolyl-tRNA editing protein ProX n=1 Tax=bioreactor metagenome TaxID=1076179 RepID=A0A644U8J1_9ZZZZ|nr:prolyl-tRNA synthetase associated domain-containing protein [Lentimicrobium sp.]MEA5109936.1 prolyl-tRNA synthetase associated domain-containing protein [Lentimicrobium sp.]
MNGDPLLYQKLDELGIPFEYHEHPPAPTIEIAVQYWKDIEETSHCKNLFFRNHKGNRHYLVIVDHRRSLAIHDLEKRLKQGKLSFASGERMQRYLGLNPGSVSPFGLIHDPAQHVYLFLDKNLKNLPKISFHPNDNTASLVIRFSDFLRFLDHCGNGYEFIELYSPEDVM